MDSKLDLSTQAAGGEYCNGNGISTISETVLSIDSPTTIHGSVMSFHNVSYTVNLEKMCCGSFRSKQPKIVLHEVSGAVRPGLNVIMGSTGSGKSTLLDVLANRKDPDCLTGEVYLDGHPVPKNLQYLSGYVVQNDQFIATVTVREALWFCANLRLPKSVSREEKSAKIEQSLKDLGLQACADTRIGNDITRGISGGEKKRAAIAAELILEPKILFLDEPTTGLDAATAWSVVSMLKRLGDQGHTVVCSIHQPRYSIYKLFDFMTLLSSGNVVYQGPASGTLGYFEELGYQCETHDNPADFFLDILNGEHEDKNECVSRSSQEQLVELTDFLKNSFQKSSISLALDAELSEIQDRASETKQKSGKMYANGFWRQMQVLLGRTGRDMIRNPQMLLVNTLMNLAIAVVFGLIYLQVPDTPDKGVQNRLGILFFFCTNFLFGASLVIDNFVAEQDIFIHEHVSGYYSVASYFLSKILADLIPLRTIAPIAFCAITYWMVGLKPEVGAVFTFLLVAALGGYAAVGIGLAFASSFSKGIAHLVTILIFIITIMFSGMLVNLEDMEDWLSWLAYLSVCRYALVALSVNEFRGLIFTQCVNATDGSAVSSSSADAIQTNGTVCTVVNGEAILHETLSIGASADDIDDWTLWQNILALGCMATILFAITYIQLARRRMYS